MVNEGFPVPGLRKSSECPFRADELGSGAKVLNRALTFTCVE